VASTQGEIAQRHVTITRTYESSAELTAIEPDLHRSFVNVIQNALENLTDGGRIRIRLSNSRNWQTQTRGIRIVIADTGYGIPKERLQSLFNPFVSTKLQRGSGLDLWVVRTIAEKCRNCFAYRVSPIFSRRNAFTVKPNVYSNRFQILGEPLNCAVIVSDI
jgi:signal transduction histidine kinase